MRLETDVIFEEIQKLPEEIKTRLIDDTLSCMNNKEWLSEKHLDCGEVYTSQVMEIIFKEKYQGKY